MKKENACLALALLASVGLIPLTVHAQSSAQQGQQTTAETALSDGEIRKIDKAMGKITIRHGPIKHLDMPPMNMVFTVKNTALFDQIKVGDKIQFMAVDEGGGKLVVTDIELAK